MKILLFGDSLGIPQLLRHLPRELIAGIVGAIIRPQYEESLRALAKSHNLTFLLQPKWKSSMYEVFLKEVQELSPDLIWVNSYSMIIREDVLAISRLGGINIHAALLPRNRGCNPTQWAILNGDHKTGVTLHEIDNGIDTGPIIDQIEIPIFFEDTWLEVRHRIVQAIDVIIIKNLPKILSESWIAVPQINGTATFGKRRLPEDGLFHWIQPLVEIYNTVRALLPPLPTAFYKDKLGKKRLLDSYHTIWQLAILKYEQLEGGGMQAENVRLRPLQKSDANLLYEWIKDREFVINNSPFFPVSESDHEAWIEKMMTKKSDLVVFVIEELASGKAIGTCQLLNINWIHRSAELQIRIGSPTFQGRGFGSEAVNLLCGFGFADLNLHRIYLNVFITNKKAIRVYKKCGFECHGTLKEAAYIDGRWIDVLVMSQLEPKSNG